MFSPPAKINPPPRSRTYVTIEFIWRSVRSAFATSLRIIVSYPSRTSRVSGIDEGEIVSTTKPSSSSACFKYFALSVRLSMYKTLGLPSKTIDLRNRLLSGKASPVTRTSASKVSGGRASSVILAANATRFIPLAS